MTQPTLEYAPPPGNKWKRHLRLATLAAVIMIAMWGGNVLRKAIRQRTALIKMQDQCLNFRAQQNTLVYGENEDATLITSVPPYTNTPGGWSYSGERELMEYRGRTSQWIEAIRSAVRLGSSAGNCAATYIGQRTTPDGRTVIVGTLLDCDRFRGGGMSGSSVVANPIGYVGNGEWTGAVSPFTLGPWPAQEVRVRYYAGQPDAANASRFSFDYEIGTERGSVVGTVNNDLTVTLTPTTGPLSRPNP